MKKEKILPSLMVKNQKELEADFKRLKGAAKTLHLDIVDGKFALNQTFQFPFKLSKSFSYQAHLMVKNPESWLAQHLKKVKAVFFHPELLKEKKIISLIKKIRQNKKLVGLALKPETSIKKIKPYLKKIDYLLILTVRPGFYGSKYLPDNLKKIKPAKQISPKIKVIIDGGMNPQTIKEAAQAGADYFVSGSYTAKAKNPKSSIKALLEAAAS